MKQKQNMLGVAFKKTFKPINLIKLNIIIFLMVILSLSSCGVGVETKPELVQIKKSAFLSVYINNEFYNYATYKEDIGIELLNFFDQQVGQKDNQVSKILVDYFVSKFFKRYQSQPTVVKVMDIVHPNEYTGDPHFKLSVRENAEAFDAFEFDNTYKIEELYFIAAKGLKLIPINSLVKQVRKEGEGGGQVSDSISFETIGKFSKNLGMDGMFIAELDASYEKIPHLAGSKIKPLLNIRIILIDNQGKQVLAIGKEAKSERKHFTGDVVEAGINDKDKIIFSSNPAEIEVAYRVAVDKALDSIFVSMAGLR